ncbi:HAD-IC family P-type ATPase [Xylocopilactobacillus apis]|uniref:ATPase P n=1 Tax=Xylocopilactobacillus apis TaxID=2932183 RepID=A0AAU9CWW7_9LACO|nr:HAD-IC family P-type ATPase [Xylocopilactobacillus apis]BDR56931.1 ATPase P [Xylocopilactobacillus apis]
MKKKNDGVMAIIAKNIFTYFNAIFLGISVLLIVAGSYRNLTFLPIVIANTLIGIYQQLKAKRILDKLSLISEAKYQVLRNGNKEEVVRGELLRDDVIFLASGQQIPADAEVVEGKISVNEALLTGESDEIEKIHGTHLMSGSFVVSGNCRARLTAVGEDSYIAKLQAKAKEVKEKPSEMVGDINLIVKIAGIAIIPIGLILFFEGIFLKHEAFNNVIVSMVGALIGMIPEGLYLLVTVALALSAARLAKHQVLLHDMRSTETLARVDVLCVDKTGTITDNKMNVTEIFDPVGATPDEVKNSKNLLASYVATSPDNNITAQALKKYYPDGQKLDTVNVIPFSSKLKYSEIETADAHYFLGAPEFVLGDHQNSKDLVNIDNHAAKGERVLVFAKEENENNKALLFISIANGIRPNAKETFKYFAEQEVKVMVISGDNPITVSKIAKMVEIPGAEKYIDATTLKTKEDLRDAINNYSVFGRVKPDQKREIVKAIKANGQRVAMTGDGVNDILAMKEANCSIAIGSGSDAAKQSAQVVLLDSDFSHMKEIISEGRRDINNLTRSATLFLYKNIFSMLLAIFAIIGVISYPLQPSQISLISMFNIGIPAFALAFEANDKKQHGRFIRVTFLKSLPAAITSFLAIASLVIFGMVFSIKSTDVSVASTFLLSLAGFMLLFEICKPMNGYRNFVFYGSIIGLIACAYFFHYLFAINSISYQCVMLAAVFAVAQESVMRNLTSFFGRFQK